MSLSSRSANILFTSVRAENFLPLFRYKKTIRRITAGEANVSSVNIPVAVLISSSPNIFIITSLESLILLDYKFLRLEIIGEELKVHINTLKVLF